MSGTLSVRGSVKLSFNGKLSSFNLGGHVDGTVNIESNEALGRIDGMPSMNALYMNANNVLQSVSFNSLTPLDTLKIEGNGAITQIVVTGVTSVRQIGISSNDALTTLKLPQLRWASEMDVQYNPKLPSCLKATFDAQLAGSGVYAWWTSNNDLATCS